MPPSPAKALRSVLGAFLGISLVGALLQYGLHDTTLHLEIGAFGATAVLLYAAPLSPYAQPWNVVLGHVLSALIGVAVFKLLGATWLSAALSVSLAIGAMQLTASIHPPGGATALIATLGTPEIHALGFGYALYPVGLGVAVMIAVAAAINNIGAERRWPEYWSLPGAFGHFRLPHNGRRSAPVPPVDAPKQKAPAP